MNTAPGFGQIHITKDEELTWLRGQLQELSRFVEGAQAKPSPMACIVAVDSKRTTIIGPGVGLMEVLTPNLKALRDQLRPGVMVHIDPKSAAVVEAYPEAPIVGTVQVVERLVGKGAAWLDGGRLVICDPDKPPAVGDQVILDPTGYVLVKNLGPKPAQVVEPDDGPQAVRIAVAVLGNRVEIETPGGPALLVFEGGVAPKPGERMVLNSKGTKVVGNLGKPPSRATPAIDTGISWDDVGGLVRAKAELREALETPVLHAELYAEHGLRRPKGALLCGPPGCGKTHLARAAVTEIAKLFGSKWSPTGLIYIKGPEILDKFQGESERKLRAAFDAARAHKATHGYPAIMFFDEADALFGARGRSRLEGAEKTIVPQVLAEIDGLENDGSFFVLAATNRPDMLDSAFTREGRIDLKVEVERPTEAESVEICSKHLRRRPIDGMTIDEAAHAAAEQMYHARHVLYMVRTKSRKDERLGLGQLASGAKCENIVNRATMMAFRRALAKPKSQRGIVRDDFARAADELCAAQRMLDHTNDLQAVAERLGSDFVTFEKKGG